MSAASRICNQLTFPGLDSDISSPVLPDGASLCDLPGSRMMPTSGPDPVRVRGSRRPASDEASLTLVISGLHGSGSSASADLQLSLESRLRAGLDGHGSILYSLTWKVKATPAQRRICRLAASARRIGDSAYSSWPTPTVSQGDYQYDRARSDGSTPKLLKLSGAAKLVVTAPAGIQDAPTAHRGSPSLPASGSPMAAWPTPLASNATGIGSRGTGGENLQTTAKLSTWPSLLGAARHAAWPTPTTQDADRGGSMEHMDGRRSNLRDSVMLSAWATPAAHEAGGTPKQFLARKQAVADSGISIGVSLTSLSLQAQLTADGTTANGSHAPMASRGQLNPEHTRWLMGFPREWASCAPTATRSSRK